MTWRPKHSSFSSLLALNRVINNHWTGLLEWTTGLTLFALIYSLTRLNYTCRTAFSQEWYIPAQTHAEQANSKDDVMLWDVFRDAPTVKLAIMNSKIFPNAAGSHQMARPGHCEFEWPVG